MAGFDVYNFVRHKASTQFKVSTLSPDLENQLNKLFYSEVCSNLTNSGNSCQMERSWVVEVEQVWFNSIGKNRVKNVRSNMQMISFFTRLYQRFLFMIKLDPAVICPGSMFLYWTVETQGTAFLELRPLPKTHCLCENAEIDSLVICDVTET